MAAARSTFSKFTLKPSALSQHTANFNKMLEQVPVPKIESLDLVKPLNKNVLTTSESNPAIGTTVTPDKEEKPTTTEEAAPKFVFGEQLNDRVVNVANPDSNDATSLSTNTVTESSDAKAANKDESVESKAASSTLWPLAGEAGNEDALEQNEANTIAKFNCKLYVLETEKVNWLERGYGVMRLVDSNDGHNCKLMMWTDKCFRLILNTKLFDKMQIDRANKKSIRFNAMDNGVIRIFLMKMANQNDCDDLMETWESRLQTLREKSLKPSSSSSSLSNSNTNENFHAKSDKSADQPALDEKQKKIIFECTCDFYVTNSTEDEQETAHPAHKIHLYSYPAAYDGNNSSSNLQSSAKFENHQLLIDILNAESKICLTTYLKFVKTKLRSKLKSSTSSSSVATNDHSVAKSDTEFEINDVLLLGPGLNNFTANDQSSKNVYKVVIHEKTALNEFLSLHSKEPKFCTNVDWSNDDSNNDDEDTSYDRGEESGTGDAGDDDLNRNSQEGSSNFGQENDDDEPNRKSNSTNGSGNFDSSEENDDSSSQITSKEKFAENTNSNSLMSTTDKPELEHMNSGGSETNRKRKNDEPLEGEDYETQAPKKQEIVASEEAAKPAATTTIQKRNVDESSNDENDEESEHYLKKSKVAEDVA